MTPTVALIVAELAKTVPALAIDLIRLFNKPEATEADWDALRARWHVHYETQRQAATDRAG